MIYVRVTCYNTHQMYIRNCQYRVRVCLCVCVCVCVCVFAILHVSLCRAQMNIQLFGNWEYANAILDTQICICK